ncbi:MAG: glycosyltransferase [Candidatus Hodarchaeales archaeon]
MVAARIEGKKGIREVAQACADLGYRFLLVGRVSRPAYMKQILDIGVEFKEDVTDEELRNLYKRMTVLVCNSVDNFECYDDKTEVLTEDGWKKIKDVKNEKVATLNPQSNYLEFQKPIRKMVYDYKGVLYSVDNRSLSFAVTPNHKMWVSTRTTDKNRKAIYKPYRFVEAKDLPQSFKIQRTCKWKGNRYKEGSIDWYRFMGIWLAEGSVYRQSKNSCRITISAVKKEEKKKIRGLLTKMGFDFQEIKDGFRFSERQNKGYRYKFGRYLEQFGKAPEKFVPKEILNARPKYINEFLEWFSYGDGMKYNGNRIFFTSSEKLADGIQECLLKIGKNVYISKRKRKKKRWIVDHWANTNEIEYVIYEKSKKLESYVRKNLDLKKIKYNGKVYCLEVPNHILLVRRNKKTMFCGNSGTLPILEAMAMGVPVLTRNVGHVPDIYNEKNMVVRSGKTEDLEDLKNELKALMDNRKRMLELREEGWKTVKDFSDAKMARRYARLYNKVLFEEPLVSVIIPTYNRKKQVLEILEALDEQNYQNIEAIIADDNSVDGTESAVKSMREKVRYPIKYLNTNRDGYNLAMARNMAVIEADGEAIVFCDSRLKPYEDAIYQFAKRVLRDKEKVWYFGNKGSGKRSFVENFSAVRRSYLIRAGMFNERITEWGGTTQEISTRFKSQGFKFRYLPFARAKEILSSKSKYRKKESLWKMKFLLWKLYGI